MLKNFLHINLNGTTKKMLDFWENDFKSSFDKHLSFLKKNIENQSIYNFLVNKWYFDELYNCVFVEPVKKIGLFLWRKGDINTIDKYGPDGLSRLIKIISDKAVNFQSGYLYHYAFVMLVGFSILLTYLILT